MKFSEAVQDLARAQEANTPAAKAKRAALSDAYFAGMERKLQGDCENWLRQRGYYSRTPENIAAHWKDGKWFIHVHKARCNPILLDLLILNNGRYLEVELKTRDGAMSTEQTLLCRADGLVCRSLEQFISILRNWEVK